MENAWDFMMLGQPKEVHQHIAQLLGSHRKGEV